MPSTLAQPTTDMPVERRSGPHFGGPLRWLLRLVALLVVAVFAVWLVLFITKGRFLKPYFERYASQEAGRPVRVAGDFNLYFAPFNVFFKADGMTVQNPVWAHAQELFVAQHFALTLRTLPLIFGKREIAWVDLENASIAPEWDAHHKANTWTFATTGAAFQIPAIDTGTILGTHIAYRDPLLQIYADIALDPVRATASKLDGGLGFSGTGSLRGKPVRFAGAVSALQNAVDGGRFGLKVHAEAADTIVDVSGRIPGLTRIESAPLHLAIRGRSMSDLFGFIGVAVVPTRRYHIAADMVHADGSWDFSHIHGLFGDSDLAGTLSIAMPKDRLTLDADLATHALDVLDAGPFIGYDPQRLDAEGAKGAITHVNGTPRLLPDAQLPVQSLDRFDADVHYRVDKITGRHFPVSNVDVTLNLDHGLLTLKPVSAIVANGKLDADVRLDARQSPVVSDFGLHLHPTPMNRLFAGFGVDQSGTSGSIGARLKLHGTGDSVRTALATADGRMVVIIPKGTMWERNIQLSELNIGVFAQRYFAKQLKNPVEINCGVLGFSVRDGISTADPVLIDTQKSVITARGDFSFRDESIGMNVKADSKKFSLFSLQSPIGVGGHFAAPAINVISPALLARGGVAAALGVINPFAAAIAFIDPGDAKAAACGPVLAGDNAAAQRTAKGKPRKDVGPLKKKG